MPSKGEHSILKLIASLLKGVTLKRKNLLPLGELFSFKSIPAPPPHALCKWIIYQGRKFFYAVVTSLLMNYSFEVLSYDVHQVSGALHIICNKTNISLILSMLGQNSAENILKYFNFS